MPFDFVLPDLGEGTTEGEVRKWTVREGDLVEEHQTVLEIGTDKAIVEVPSPKKGRVLKIDMLYKAYSFSYHVAILRRGPI